MIAADADRLLAEAWAERDALLEERDQVRADCERLALENMRLTVESNQARADLRVAIEERERLRALAFGASGLNATVDRTTALIAERDQARADLDKAVEERERLRAEHAAMNDVAKGCAADRGEAVAEVRRLRGENTRLQELLDAPPYVDCVCGGCPRKVPQAWASGMCSPCADEDCDHTP